MASVHASISPWNHNPSWSRPPMSDPPPIPARLHPPTSRDIHRPAAPFVTSDASDAYLSPVLGYEHFEAVFLPLSDNESRPPLPPRQPLRRSVSLTHRVPPEPSRAVVEPSEALRLPEPTLAEVVASLRLSQNQTHRTTHLTPASSAPLLGQVVTMSQWPLHDNATNSVSPVRVIPLARWPLLETATTGRLTMDGIVVRGPSGNSNEYVDGPTLSKADGCSQRRRTGRKSPATTGRNAAEPTTNIGIALTSDRSHNPEVVTTPVDDDHDRDRRRGFGNKIRQLLSCGSTSDVQDDAVDFCRSGGTDVAAGTICRRCGRCRCTECARSEESATLCRARTVVDAVTCMCCVRSVFYHCLKDDAGDEDDCSDEPCACCERPHCAARWAVMALLVPCFPCLCLYPPLSCTVELMCRRRHAGRACHCSQRSRPPGLKGLLESESSST